MSRFSFMSYLMPPDCEFDLSQSDELVLRRENGTGKAYSSPLSRIILSAECGEEAMDCRQ